LTSNFAEVSVSVVDCPDLSQKPFDLAAPGLGGRPALVQVGGPPNLLPTVKREKVYDIRSLSKLTADDNQREQLFLGAGAAPWSFQQRNGELVPNVMLAAGDENAEPLAQKTRAIYTKDDVNGYRLERLPPSLTHCNLLADFYACEGHGGRVVLVSCKRRTGKSDFVTAMADSLRAGYPGKAVALGGIFCVNAGMPA